MSPVDLGVGHTATEITAGNGQACAILENGHVRCWGYGINGQLGYGNTNNIGDDESPASVGTVNLGPGRTAIAISAGDAHTCAILDTHQVRCWGNGADGRLGYGNTATIGDDETPDAAGPVNLGPGRKAMAIAAGGMHTCVILDTGKVLCWGSASFGQLGYGNTNSIGDDEAAATAGTVDLGPGHIATAIAAGRTHTCAIIDTGAVRCWGNGSSGQLGYGNTANIGDDETLADIPTVSLGPGRTAVAITAGGAHSCAALDDGEVRCWGDGSQGQLGYANTNTIGDDEMPDSVGPVQLGAPFASVTHPPPPRRSCRIGMHVTRCAVGQFAVGFSTLSRQITRIIKFHGLASDATVNIRCVSGCLLDRTVRGTTRAEVRLVRRVSISARSRVRVTVSHKGQIARFKTYRFQPGLQYQAAFVKSGCATDTRATMLVKCPTPVASKR